MYWCSTGNTENIMYSKFYHKNLYSMNFEGSGQLFSKLHLKNIKPDQCRWCGDVTWRSCRDQRAGIWNQDWLVKESVVVPCGWRVAGWMWGWGLWGQESCCSTVCSEHSGHCVEAEQLSHWSPWPQDSDTAPCFPHVTQHCLCFLYTTWDRQRETRMR